ncbi:MAG: hypothetical protein CR971_00695, partial [candidate division SR1 bacterium]
KTVNKGAEKTVNKGAEKTVNKGAEKTVNKGAEKFDVSILKELQRKKLIGEFKIISSNFLENKKKDNKSNFVYYNQGSMTLKCTTYYGRDFSMNLSQFLDNRGNLTDAGKLSFKDELNKIYVQKEKEYLHNKELGKVAKYFRGRKYSLQDLFGDEMIGKGKKIDDIWYQQFASTFLHNKFEIDSSLKYTRIEGDNLVFDLDQSRWNDKTYVKSIEVPLSELGINEDYTYNEINIGVIEKKFKEKLAKKIDEIVENHIFPK